MSRTARSPVLLWALTIPLLLGCGCGRQAPAFAPGSLTVTSSPEGAAILIDGDDTGVLTPHTFAELAAGIYEVTVALPDWVTTPVERTVEVRPLKLSEADFLLSQTGLRVTSAPAGAAILLDGENTGLVTPATVAGLAPGPVVVSLELPGYLSAPAGYTATVVADEIIDVPADTFVLRARKTVMIEGFANVACLPCPEMTANLLDLTGQPGYGPDRVLFMEFSLNFPTVVDPFYLYNRVENGDRFGLGYYGITAAPALYVDGTALASAVDGPATVAAVDAALAADPGVLVDVSVDFAGSDVPVTVTVTALEDVDLTGHHLFVALWENEITVEPAPGLNGQTEFHHVFRDRVDDLPALGAIAGGGTSVHEITLVREADWDPANLTVVAFIQNDVDKSLLQAGSSLPAEAAPAALFVKAPAGAPPSSHEEGPHR